MMRLLSVPRLVLTALAALALSACGSSSDGNGRINVRLVDGPATEYAEVWLDVQRVELHANGEWKLLAEPNLKVDLLTLTNGVSASLVDGETIPAGHYTQMRLVLGPDNKVVLKDGSEHALTVPSGTKTGVKINTSFDVAENTTSDLFIDFDAHRSIFVHDAGASGKYMMRPVVRCVDRIVTGSILGTLTAAGQPLGGASVFAETVDAAGKGTVVSRAITGADGKYVLGLVPVSDTARYYVVAQPVVGAVAYEAKASGPIAVTAAAPTPGGVDVSFAPITDVGGLSGTITPYSADQGDVVSIATTVLAGGTTPYEFVIREVTAQVAAGAVTYDAPLLPAPAAYSAWVTRFTVDAVTGDTTAVTGKVATANVTVGPSATLNLDATP